MVWGKICSEKIPWGNKMGFGKTSIALGIWEKNASAKRGRGNDKFEKYIALYESQDKYLFRFRKESSCWIEGKTGVYISISSLTGLLQ